MASLAPGARVVVRGDTWRVAARTGHGDCDALRLTGCGAMNGGRSRTVLLPFDRPRPLDTPPRIRVLRRRRWLHELRRLWTTTHPAGGLRTAARAAMDLLPFQLEPALAMLRHGRLRLLIADEVGLGKTVQAGLILSELAHARDEFRALVVTPAGVREQWRAELRARFCLETTLADAAWLGTAARELPPSVNPWELPGIYVASIDLVKRPEVLRTLEDTRWDLLVIDEVHGAGPGTARITAAHALAVRSRRVVLLTATPPDGDPGHFDAVAGIGRMEPADLVTVFRRTRADAGIAGRRKTVLLAVRLTSAERRLHTLLDRYTSLVWQEAGARGDRRGTLAAIILRKRALSSARSLALSVERRRALLGRVQPGVEEQLPLPLFDEDPLPDAPPDDVIGAPGLTDADRERRLLEELAAAARAAARHESKIAFLRRFLARVNEPVIVFTEYRDTLADLGDALRPQRQPLLLHGGMTPAERTGVQRAFNASGTLLLATDAASEGLNLHHRCRVVIHFELPWTPMRLEQRTGRVDRLGQPRTVHEVLLVARHTCERLVLAPLITRVKAAAAGGRRSSLASLPESQVAAAVLGGEPLPDVPQAGPGCAVTLPLTGEGAEECRRIECIRRLSLSSDTPNVRPRDRIVTSEPVWKPMLTVILLITVAADDGVLHEELLPLSAAVVLRRVPRTPTEAARVARELAGTHVADLVAGGGAETRLAAALSAARAPRLSLVSREVRIADRLPSAASRLVQAGLFDRRALAAADARTRAEAALLDDARERIASLDPETLQGSITIAAIHVGRPLAR